ASRRLQGTAPTGITDPRWSQTESARQEAPDRRPASLPTTRPGPTRTGPRRRITPTTGNGADRHHGPALEPHREPVPGGARPPSGQPPDHAAGTNPDRPTAAHHADYRERRRPASRTRAGATPRARARRRPTAVP